MQAELERSQGDQRTIAADVYRLRAQLEEAGDASESLRRENKNLTGEFKLLNVFNLYINRF